MLQQAISYVLSFSYLRVKRIKSFSREVYIADGICNVSLWFI